MITAAACAFTATEGGRGSVAVGVGCFNGRGMCVVLLVRRDIPVAGGGCVGCASCTAALERTMFDRIGCPDDDLVILAFLLKGSMTLELYCGRKKCRWRFR